VNPKPGAIGLANSGHWPAVVDGRAMAHQAMRRVGPGEGHGDQRDDQQQRDLCPGEMRPTRRELASKEIPGERDQRDADVLDPGQDQSNAQIVATQLDAIGQRPNRQADHHNGSGDGPWLAALMPDACRQDNGDGANDEQRDLVDCNLPTSQRRHLVMCGEGIASASTVSSRRWAVNLWARQTIMRDGPGLFAHQQASQPGTPQFHGQFGT